MSIPTYIGNFQGSYFVFLNIWGIWEEIPDHALLTANRFPAYLWKIISEINGLSRDFTAWC